jgi:sugar lactone lactonase YvrE
MLGRALLYSLLLASFFWNCELRSQNNTSSPGLTLNYLTYLGGKGVERGAALAVDLSGSVYVGGATWSSNYPAVNAHQSTCDGDRNCHDAFLSKIDAAGRKLLFSTFLDENNVETVTGIATDREGNVYICAQYTGILGGVNVGRAAFSLPAGAPPPSGGFVAKFDRSGRQIYRTPLRSNGFSAPEGIAVDALGYAYVTGWMPRDITRIGHRIPRNPFSSAERCEGGFGAFVGERDAFVVKLDSLGRVLSKFTLGGNGDDAGYAIALDRAGHAYVTGSTTSEDFQGATPLQIPGAKLTQKHIPRDTDLFVAKADLVNGKLLYAKTFGGSSRDVGYAIALDGKENAYVAGGTASPDFPMTSPIQGALAGDVDAFVAKLSNDGSQLAFSTYLGASNFDIAMSMVLDAAGAVYLTGTTKSPDFPVLNIAGLKDGCQLPAKCSDAFIAKLDAKGSAVLVKGRFGGQKEERATVIALDGSGAVYVVGSVESPKMGSRTALRRSLSGVQDAFLARFEGFGSLKPNGSAPSDTSQEEPYPKLFQGLSDPSVGINTVMVPIPSGGSKQIDNNALAVEEEDSSDIPELSVDMGDLEGIAIDASGNIYFSLAADNIVMRLDSKGKFTRIAGNGTFGFSGDHGPAVDAQLAHPWGLAVDSAGSLYITDSNNCRIRKISNGIIHTVAGSGCAKSFFFDNRPAIKVHIGISHGVAIDSAGNLYFSEIEMHRIRKVSDKGVITAIAGNGRFGYSGDNGPATKAQIWSPTGVAVDSDGNVHFAQGQIACVRRVANGIIATVAGNGATDLSEDGGPAASASLMQPRGIAFDALGNLYIADSANHRIRKVSSGVITTVAGNGNPGFKGDHGPAVNARLHFPTNVAVDSFGNLYIADHDNYRIRKVSNGVITTLIRFHQRGAARTKGTYSISPN